MDTDAPIKSPTPTGLPLVRLNLIQPFIQTLNYRGIDADAVLMRNGLVKSTVMDPTIFVPVIVVHRFLEDAAEAAADPLLGTAVGESLDLTQWAPFVDAVTNSTTLLDFLVRFIRGASDEASSARHALELDSRHTFFREIRTSDQEIPPAQNDAFTAAYLLNLIKRAVGDHWIGSEVIVKVCERKVLPPRYLDASIVEGDYMGVWVRFPTNWLLYQLDKSLMTAVAPNQSNHTQLPVGFKEALRSALKLHLSNPDLRVDQVAQLLGMSRQSLQRKLKASGTTLSAELTELRKQRAIQELSNSSKSIVNVANSAGFTNSTSFTRAFKSWTGESPREYRKNHRQ